MADSRTVRARVGAELAAQIDAAMEREERTESDIVRRALRAYTFGATPADAVLTGSGKEFKGPDPRKK